MSLAFSQRMFVGLSIRRSMSTAPSSVSSFGINVSDAATWSGTTPPGKRSAGGEYALLVEGVGGGLGGVDGALEQAKRASAKPAK
jgi:hypothetical protein